MGRRRTTVWHVAIDTNKQEQAHAIAAALFPLARTRTVEIHSTAVYPRGTGATLAMFASYTARGGGKWDLECFIARACVRTDVLPHRVLLRNLSNPMYGATSMNVGEIPRLASAK